MNLSSAITLVALLARESHAARPRVGVRKSQGTKSMKSRDGTTDGTCAIAPSGDGDGSAVYAMTNQPGNEIVVFSRDRESGELEFEDRVSTGGAGGILANSVNGNFLQPATQGDPLGSTDSILVAGKCLLAVNAGSNDISTFRIISSSEIELAGTFPSGGIFPVSLTERDGLTYVLNAGGTGSIQGFGLTQFDCMLRAIQDPISLNQNAVASVPDFELASPAQISFTPEGNIVVVIKTNGGGLNFGGAPGTLDVFEIDPADGTASYPTHTVLNIPGTVPFAVDFDSEGRLLLAEAVIQGIPVNFTAGGGVSQWEYGADGTYTQVASQGVDQEATCWIRYNPKNSCSYVTNAGVDGSISSLRSTADGLVLVEQRAAALLRPVDFTGSRDGRYIYVLSSQIMSEVEPGDGQPRIHVFETGCDCGLVEVQQITDGLDDQATRIAADGFFNGFQGVAVYN